MSLLHRVIWTALSLFVCLSLYRSVASLLAEGKLGKWRSRAPLFDYLDDLRAGATFLAPLSAGPLVKWNEFLCICSSCNLLRFAALEFSAALIEVFAAVVPPFFFAGDTLRLNLSTGE